MKKLLILSLLVIFSFRVVWADDYEYHHTLRTAVIGNTDPASVLSFTLDTNLVYGTSGKTYSVAFVSAKTQSSGNFTVYYYCTAATGTPNEALAYIYNSAGAGEDADRPDTGGAAIYTSSNIDFSGCGTAGWKTASFTGVSLTLGKTYFILLANTEGAPGTDNFAVLSRGPMDYPISGFVTSGSNQSDFQSRENSDGFTTDGTLRSQAPIVIKYNDGLIVGNPYVAVGTHATNTNYRGGRITPTEDIKVVGVGFTTMDTNFDEIHVVHGSTTDASNTALDDAQSGRSGVTYFDPALLLSGGVAYDILAHGASDNFSGNIEMGNSPPADVQAAASPFTYVDGAALGSLSETTTSSFMVYLLVGDNPAITGGASGTAIGVIGN